MRRYLNPKTDPVYEYDPFGNTVVNTDTNNLFAYRFSTKPRDSETGLDYYGYRYYDPVTGRWPSRDLIEEEGGENLYKAIGNSPNNWTEYLGLWWADGGPRPRTTDYSFSYRKGTFTIMPGQVQNNPEVKKAAWDHEQHHIDGVNASEAAIVNKQVYCLSKDGVVRHFYISSNGSTLTRSPFDGDDMIWNTDVGIMFKNTTEQKAEEILQTQAEITQLKSGKQSDGVRDRLLFLEGRRMNELNAIVDGQEDQRWTAFKNKIADEKKKAAEAGYSWSWKDESKVYSEIK